MPFAADFHVHSCLSPCASLEMSPSAIASRAKSVGLDVVALTDHNSALNAPAFSDACARCGITGLYGLEICSIEEVHCLVIFDDVDKALSMSAYVFSNLPQKIDRFPNIAKLVSPNQALYHDRFPTEKCSELEQYRCIYSQQNLPFCHQFYRF